MEFGGCTSMDAARKIWCRWHGVGRCSIPGFYFYCRNVRFFAINNRINKGDNNWKLIQYVILRTIALLIMGLFLVNSETIHEEATGISRSVWNLLCCSSFILIWNDYPASLKKALPAIFKVTGIIILLMLGIFLGVEKMVKPGLQFNGGEF